MDRIIDSAKIIQKSGTFVLYLVAIYWSTEAVMKYWSEPAVTSIQYTFGDADQKIEFPALTFCPLYNFYPNIPYYVKVLSNECQLPLQQECLFRLMILYFFLLILNILSSILLYCKLIYFLLRAIGFCSG